MKRYAAKVLVTLLAWSLVSGAGAMSCVVETAPQFVFGSYDPQSPVPHDVQASLAVQCTPAFRGEILTLQISFAGIPAGTLKMRNPASGETLNFGMYRDAARTQSIDVQTVLSFSTPLLVTTTLSLPVYGRIPARQNVSVGNYHLPINVILNF